MMSKFSNFPEHTMPFLSEDEAVLFLRKSGFSLTAEKSWINMIGVGSEFATIDQARAIAYLHNQHGYETMADPYRGPHEVMLSPLTFTKDELVEIKPVPQRDGWGT